MASTEHWANIYVNITKYYYAVILHWTVHCTVFILFVGPVFVDSTFIADLIMVKRKSETKDDDMVPNKRNAGKLSNTCVQLSVLLAY